MESNSAFHFVTTNHMKTPTGRVQAPQVESDVNVKRYASDQYYYIYTWSFNLHRLLRQNLTFHNIHFPAGKCKCIRDKSDINYRKNKLSFCGIQSYFMFYPFPPSVDIVLSVRIIVYYYIKYSFSIIDEGRLISFLTKGIFHPNDFIYKLLGKNSLRRIEIKQLKSKHINVRISTNVEGSIFDVWYII